ncbi:MAG: excinuclease ABC subunit C [Paludibacteraceae bacterium]|nr:excinuclease ABC subunit C [Paludibacteraceae bacterium]
MTNKNKTTFTDKYNIEYCIYYEYFNRIEEAIIREKQIKGLTRAKKEKLINTMNPTWSEILEIL